MRSTDLPGVVQASYVADYTLDIQFNDGTRKFVDVSQWFKGPVFEPLRKKTYFKKFFLDSATVAWPNGVDIAPEALYEAQDVRESQGHKPSRSRRKTKGH